MDVDTYMQTQAWQLSQAAYIAMIVFVCVVIMLMFAKVIFELGARRGRRDAVDATKEAVFRAQLLRDLQDAGGAKDSGSDEVASPVAERAAADPVKPAAATPVESVLPTLPTEQPEPAPESSEGELDASPPSKEKSPADDIYLPEEARQFLEQSTTDHEER